MPRIAKLTASVALVLASLLATTVYAGAQAPPASSSTRPALR